MKLIIFLLCTFSSGIFAADLKKDISLEFKDISINEFSNAVLKNILQKNYVIANNIVNNGSKFNINVKNIDKNHLLAVFKNTLQQSDLKLAIKDDIYFIEKQQIEVTSNETQSNGASGGSLESLSQSAKQTNDTIAIANNPNTILPSDTIKPFDTSKQKYISYQPKSRSIAFLSKLVSFAGGKPLLIDDHSNDLFYAVPDDETQTKINDLLIQIDKPQKGLTIKAALIEYTNSKDSSRSLSGVLSLLTGKLGIVYNAGATLANAITFKGKTLQMAISAIDGDSNFKYLAEPTIRVLNGEKAKLIVGSEVPIRGQTTVAEGVSTTSIEYKTSGLEFNVLPKIMGDEISLYINQTISNFANTTTSNIDSPTLFKRQAETTLDVHKGELIIMAGLDETKSSNSKSGLSFLPPFLQSKSKSESKSQILLLLEILDDKPQAKAI